METSSNQSPRGRRISLQGSSMQATILAVREAAAAAAASKASAPPPVSKGAHRPSVTRNTSSLSVSSFSAPAPSFSLTPGAKGSKPAEPASNTSPKKGSFEKPAVAVAVPAAPEQKSRTIKKGIRTVGTQYLDSLEELMFTLEGSNCFYVCCLKPNDQQLPDVFAEDTTLRQLRYLGLAQTVKIRRQGFSLRMSFQEFLRRFWILNPRAVGYHPKLKATPKQCQTLLASLGHKEMVEWQVGKTKASSFSLRPFPRAF